MLRFDMSVNTGTLVEDELKMIHVRDSVAKILKYR